MILYQHHSLERSYMSLMKMEMKMILVQSLAVGSKLHSCGMTLLSTFPPLCSSLSLSLLPISLKWKSTHFFSHAALVAYALITKVCLKQSN